MVIANGIRLFMKSKQFLKNSIFKTKQNKEQTKEVNVFQKISGTHP